MISKAIRNGQPTMKFPLLSIFLLFIHHYDKCSCNHDEFGYHGKKGPTHWANELKYPSCAGKMQSPINIDVEKINRTRFPVLQFKGFDSLPITSILSNNGHTVMLSLTTSELTTISGGPLTGDYVFAQLHFHWGANDTVGSEDLINGQSFPMELHLVFYKSDYGDINRAMTYSDGLCVLAVFYEAYDFENTVYSEIVEHLDIVIMPHSTVRLHSKLTLDDLLPSNKHNYYTYRGSLTTPPCLEIVTWIDFTEPIPLSHHQISRFRKLQSLEGAMTENFRPVQPLGDRLVFFNIGQKMPHHHHHHSKLSYHKSIASSLKFQHLFYVLILFVLKDIII